MLVKRGDEGMGPYLTLGYVIWAGIGPTIQNLAVRRWRQQIIIDQLGLSGLTSDCPKLTWSSETIPDILNVKLILILAFKLWSLSRQYCQIRNQEFNVVFQSYNCPAKSSMTLVFLSTICSIVYIRLFNQNCQFILCLLLSLWRRIYRTQITCKSESSFLQKLTIPSQSNCIHK